MRRRRMNMAELLGEEDAEGELNLTPYLDIITTLVIFMIFTFQVIIEFSLVEVFMPAGVAEQAGSSQDPAVTPSLIISRQDGFWTFIPSGAEPAHIPLLGDPKDLKYDFPKLKETLIAWKRDFGLGEAIVLIADDEMPYDVVVETMDAIRMDGEKLLFPDVSLGSGNTGVPQ